VDEPQQRPGEGQARRRPALHGHQPLHDHQGQAEEQQTVQDVEDQVAEVAAERIEPALAGMARSAP
jgi:hypothetical protein